MLYITIIILNILDMITTIIGVNLGGIESNPFINHVIQNWGFTVFALIKISLCIPIYHLYKNPVNGNFSKIVMFILNMIYFWVVMNNFWNIILLLE